jgi:hypothetical protein
MTTIQAIKLGPNGVINKFPVEGLIRGRRPNGVVMPPQGYQLADIRRTDGKPDETAFVPD